MYIGISFRRDRSHPFLLILSKIRTVSARPSNGAVEGLSLPVKMEEHSQDGD